METLSTEIPEEAVRAATEAFYKANLDRATETALSTAFHELDIEATIRRCLRETDRGAAVLMFSAAETLLQLGFDRVMTSGDKKTRRSLFENNGPLSTAHNRILMAHALSWINIINFNSLNTLRRIRNTFAHTLSCDSFNDEPVRSLIGLLPNVEASMSAIKIEGLVPKGEYDLREVYLIRSIGVLYNTELIYTLLQ